MAGPQKVTCIKPHHFADILRTLGREGPTAFQPHPYGHHLHVVAGKILNDAECWLQVELGVDEICQPCVHHVRDGCDDTIDTSFRPLAPSSKQEWNLLIDRRWCKAMDLDQGDRLPAAELCCRIVRCIESFSDIYRELPKERIAQRRKELLQGAKMFASGDL